MPTELRPHLSFLEPTTEPKIDPLEGRGAALVTPALKSQLSRFKNKIGHVNRQFAEHIQLCESVEGLSPEKILVLEIAGGISGFAKALQKVEGFSDVVHFLSNEVVEEDIVYSETKGKRKPVTREIYLTMSNQDGLRRLVSRWQQNAETGHADHGFTPLKHALSQLHDIRFWDTQDRIKNTGLLEDWEYRIENPFDLNADTVFFEIELWFSSSVATRKQTEKNVRELIKSHGGTINSTFEHVGIAYHGLHGELPIDQVKLVVEKGASEVQLMRCDSIMFFRPLGQCGFGLPEDASSIMSDEIEAEPLEDHKLSDAVVALFDGLPMENHAALAKRMSIDDPELFAEEYNTAGEQLHGTAMASLIIHGDKNVNERPIGTPLYVRPILAPGTPDMDGRRMERIPEGILPLDLIHRAVRRLFEGDGQNQPVAPNIKAINLSVCYPSQLFDRNVSPWARMIDWLSYKYNVLFVVSAGNHTNDLELDVTNAVFSTLSAKEKEKLIVESINRGRALKRLMSPAEAINAITVSAVHDDGYVGQTSARAINPFITDGMASPINPITLGKANGIKPDLMLPGGKVTYRNLAILDSELVRLSIVDASRSRGPGHLVAAARDTPGSIKSYAYSSGTSNAAALATRRIAFLHQTVSSMRQFQFDKEALTKAPESLVLKALLVHGAEVPGAAAARLEDILFPDENKNVVKSNQGSYFGYGQVDERRIHACSFNQATLLRAGKICLDHSDLYSFPLPPCLSGSTEKRRMVVTLAWFSPINPSHQEYRQAQMWVSDPKKNQKLPFESGDYYRHHQKKGSVFHDVVTGSQAGAYIEGSEIKLRVNCKSRGGGKDLLIPYVLVVTLDTENVALPVYNEIKTLIEQKLEQSQTAEELA